MHPINKPEVFVTFAGQKIDEQGALTDEATRKIIKQLLESLVAWARKLNR
jgi:chromate reductase